MKRLIRLFCLIAAATALGSCARDKVIPDEELARIFRDATSSTPTFRTGE